jgi:hypothetical protein
VFDALSCACLAAEIAAAALAVTDSAAVTAFSALSILS